MLQNRQATEQIQTFLIDYDRIYKGYYYTDQTFFIQNVLVSEGEVVALVGLLPLHERYDNTPLKETFVKVLNPPELKKAYREEVQKMIQNLRLSFYFIF